MDLRIKDQLTLLAVCNNLTLTQRYKNEHKISPSSRRSNVCHEIVKIYNILTCVEQLRRDRNRCSLLLGDFNGTRHFHRKGRQS